MGQKATSANDRTTSALPPKSTDERAKRHRDQANRERFEKDIEDPRERFRREAAKAAFERSKRAPEPEPVKD